GPVAEGERGDFAVMAGRLLAAGERADLRAELLDSQFPGELGVEDHLARAGVDEEGGLLAVDPDTDQRQRVGPDPFHGDALPPPAERVGGLALEALQLLRPRFLADSPQERRGLVELVAAVVDFGQ